MASQEDIFGQKPPIEEKGWFGMGVTYQSYWDKFQRPPLTDVMKWKFGEVNESNIPKDKEILDKYMPIEKISKESLQTPPQDKIQVTWIGHATVLVQLEGLSILCDPVFSEYCGPDRLPGMKKLGYRRYRLAACEVQDLPRIDAVIISHNHYDHLDTESVKQINKHHKGVTWFVALKTKDWLISKGIDSNDIQELTWWKSTTLNKHEKSYEFTCTPSQHWCQRGAADLNKALWCSWVVKSPSYRYFFGGDTGYYGPLFKEIGNQYGPFDLAAIPIGAYKPRWILKYQHADPEDAVNIHCDIKSQNSIGIHWGTFKTSACEPMLDSQLLPKWKELGTKHSHFNPLAFKMAVPCSLLHPLWMELGTRHGHFECERVNAKRNITKYQHVNPEEAVDIHKDLKSKQSVAIHWGTFELTNEFFLEPPNKVKEHMTDARLDPTKFISLRLGETWKVGDKREESPFMGVTQDHIAQSIADAKM